MKQVAIFAIVLVLLAPGTVHATPSPTETMESIWQAMLHWVSQVLDVDGDSSLGEAEEEPPILSHGGTMDPAG